MSEATETTEEYDFSTDPHGVTLDDVMGQDVLLDVLLAMNNGPRDDRKSSMNLTVAVDGLVISGVAISATEWRRRMVESLTTANESFGSAFNTIASEVAEGKSKLLDIREAEGRPNPALRFIHMRNAYIVSGNTSRKMPLWRGSLAKLSGWSFGSINTPEESKEN